LVQQEFERAAAGAHVMLPLMARMTITARPHWGPHMMAKESDRQSCWRERAAETRARAEKTRDRATREDLLQIAETYKRLAELPEQMRHWDPFKPAALMPADEPALVSSTR
jgi:hypothetical protein